MKSWVSKVKIEGSFRESSMGKHEVGKQDELYAESFTSLNHQGLMRACLMVVASY